MKHYRVKTSGKWSTIAELLVPYSVGRIVKDRELRKQIRKVLVAFVAENVKEAFALVERKGVFSIETQEMNYQLKYNEAVNIYELQAYNEELELAEVDEEEFNNAVQEYSFFA